MEGRHTRLSTISPVFHESRQSKRPLLFADYERSHLSTTQQTLRTRCLLGTIYIRRRKGRCSIVDAYTDGEYDRKADQHFQPCVCMLRKTALSLFYGKWKAFVLALVTYCIFAKTWSYLKSSRLLLFLLRSFFSR